MDNKQLALGAIGLGGLAATAHYLIRTYTRAQTRLAITESGTYNDLLTLQKYLRVLKIELNLPPVDELAASMVPILGFNSPYDAADDIVANGRTSKYWPKEYAKSSINSDVERDLLKVFRNLRTAMLEQDENKDSK